MIIRVSVPNRFQLKTVPSFRTVLTPKQGEVHYIGGASILPPPLESEEGGRMISLLGGESDKHAHSFLIKHNLRLVVHIAKKLDNTSMGVEDLISIGTIGLIKTINISRPDKNIKLVTYVSRRIENEILACLWCNNKAHLKISMGEPLNVDWGGNGLLLPDILGIDEDMIYHNIEDETEKSLLSNAISHLNPRERKTVEPRYNLTDKDGEEIIQKEMVDLLDISQSCVSRPEKKTMKRLKKEVIKSE